MKKILSYVAAAALVFAMTACSPKQDENAVQVVLDWTPNTNHTGMYVALENGYYEEAGLSVEIIQPPEEGALALLGSGRVQYAVDFQESMGPAIAAEDPLPVTAVAAIISHNTSGIISLKDSGIESPKDLEGKRFAAWPSDLVDRIMENVIREDGGSFDQVTMLPDSVTDVISALQADVDAVWIYYAWDGIATELYNLDTNYQAFGDLNPVFDFYTPVLATNDAYMAENPEKVAQFLEATAKGYQFAMEHPEEAAAILVKHAPELDEELVLRSQQYLAGQYQADAEIWGLIDPNRWAAFYDWMYQQGLLERNLEAEGFTNEFLPGYNELVQ